MKTTMTGRECLEAILRGETPPRLCWTTLVDDLTRSVMPEPVRALSPLDFYRHIGCDILQFGNYGLPAELQMISPARRVEPPQETEHATRSDGTQVTTVRTEWGELTSCSRGSHPTKHPVVTLADVRVAQRMWEGTRYECHPEERVSATKDLVAQEALRSAHLRCAAQGDKGCHPEERVSATKDLGPSAAPQGDKRWRSPTRRPPHDHLD